MKKFLSFICALTMAASFAACGDKEEATESSVSESSALEEVTLYYDTAFENDYFSFKYPSQWKKSKGGWRSEEYGVKLELSNDIYICCYRHGPYEEYEGMTNEEYILSDPVENSDIFKNTNGIKFVNYFDTSGTVEQFMCLNSSYYLIKFEFYNFSQNDTSIITDFMNTIQIANLKSNTTISDNEKETSKSDPTTETSKNVTEKPTEKNTEPTTEPITEIPATEAPKQNAAELYQSVLDEYTIKIKEAVPGLIEEYNQEIASNADGINGLAEIYTAKVEKLAEISNEGVGEMAEIYLNYGSGSYSEYEEWSGKLMDVYMKEAEQLTDVYVNSAL